MGILTNLLFAIFTLQCIVNGAENEEQNVTCLPGQNQIANPSDPHSFYKCEDGRTILFQCPQNHWYVSEFQACILKTDGVNRSKGTGGSNNPDNDSWAQNQAPSYSNGGFWWTQSSPRPEDLPSASGTANKQPNIPFAEIVSGGKCNKNGPQYMKNPANCSTFFLCLQGEVVLTKCPDNLYYSSEEARCQSSKPNDCTLPA